MICHDDYAAWHHAQVVTGDIDPMYPVLTRLADRWGLDAEQRLWLCVCHAIWYDPGSTMAAFTRVSQIADLPASFEGLEAVGLLSLPTGTERRGHRSKSVLARHLLTLPCVMPNGVAEWVSAALDGIPATHAWSILNNHLAAIPGNGRWAAYKTSELWQKVAGLPIEASDAGHRYSTGPRKGLALIYKGEGVPDPNDQTVEAVARLDWLTAELADRIGERDLAQVETSLCDFHSLVRGRYYLGHDIDGMLQAWHHPAVAWAIGAEAWQARAESFPAWTLGEMEGWTGIRRELKAVYRDTGRIVGAERIPA